MQGVQAEMKWQDCRASFRMPEGTAGVKHACRQGVQGCRQGCR